MLTKNLTPTGQIYDDYTLIQEKNTDNLQPNKQDPFNPYIFKETTNLISDLLEKHLLQTDTRGLKLTDPSVLTERAKEMMVAESNYPASLDENRLLSILKLYLETGIPVQSKGYMGRQFSSPIPLSGITDFVSSIINQPSSFYEAAQLPNVVEKIIANKFFKLFGWNNNSPEMITTSGGSLANMTAILAARNNAYPDVWKEGYNKKSELLKPAIAVSETAHYSITRAAGILGIGENQIIKLETNDKYQIDITKAIITLNQAKAKGLNVFCLVASAGSTSVGAIDNLDELGAIAKKRDIWFHIDGAHGGAIILSDKLKDKLKGIDQADSIVIDAHKTLFVPGTCTLLFYKNKLKAKQAFQQQASYVFEKDEDIYTAYDSADKNFECTKRPMIMNLWVPWAVYGKSVFSRKLEYLFKLTQLAYNTINISNDFVAHHQPETNIFCFSYKPKNIIDIDTYDFQLAIRDVIKQDGRFFISKVMLENKTVLRVVFMNHNLKISDFEKLLDAIRLIGQKLLESKKHYN
ncbi:pyridoxal phosphate-dependent decarboxylase family protein [Saccharicrinis aurantiacus]|uniref:pyridoxal phosphate-dependent decarboxylase family protein n=1 Tax=Saccharicrinis aurantiacus TaxID=1849719 RepID=UPI0009F87945|nr:aminotransferase class V-fold PLP-dependent enzyme [Saccharicrinis aurantiacus]